jgi:hypothetical protein
MGDGATIEAMRTAADAIKSGDPRQVVRCAQAAQDALDAVKAQALAQIGESRVFELDGASTLNTWVRNELRLSAKDASALVRASSTMAQLPEVADAARSGVIRAEHVAVFTYGLKHVGAQTMVESQPWLLDVARHHEPNQLLRTSAPCGRRSTPTSSTKPGSRAWTSKTSRSTGFPAGGM